MSPTGRPRLGLFHRAFDKLYPLIRFFHETVRGNPWYSEVAPGLWLGGAPTRAGDYAFLVDHGIAAVVDIRAERADDTAFYDRHGIAYVRYEVADLGVPDVATIASAVDWIGARQGEGRTVLVHCAKGRGRSATLLAAYLMASQGMSYAEAASLLVSRRPLTRLEDRHRRMVEAWWARRT